MSPAANNSATSLMRTNSQHPHFLLLVSQLDEFLTVLNGDQHAFYAPLNSIALINHAVIACYKDEPVACGAFKAVEPTVAEIKRMYTRPDMRGMGLGALVLRELETWAASLGFEKCILETSRRLTPAIKLYRRSGYLEIPNYGQYIDVADSICFEKLVSNA